MGMYRETHIRSVVKTITWRFCATLTTVLLVLGFTKQADVALTVGGLEAVIKMLIYFFHERTWDRVKFGRKEIHPAVIWLTGYSGSGKTTIGKALTEKLSQQGIKVDHLDGETIRHIFPDTGFTKEEVNQHIERVGYLASRLEQRGVSVVASFLSPYAESRAFVRNVCQNFVEVHVNTPLSVCEERQNDNLYKKARAGEIKNLPGVDLAYEVPENPELKVDTSIQKIDEIVKKIIKHVHIN